MENPKAQTPTTLETSLPMAQGSNNNDAFAGSAAQFMQVTELQKQFMDQQMSLWQAVLNKKPGQDPAFKVAPEPGDRRFSAPEWKESPIYDYLHQAYLLNTQYLKQVVEVIPAEDAKSKERMRFLARQMADAMAPSNFAATNPEFIKLALETKGQSITDGINNLIKDFEKGRISMTDESVFEVGRNIATTEGAVVYENELMQLIQYAPLTPKVGTRPLVVVPPCINKFYIMDLQPDNSLIRFMVEQGNTVFLVSWRNPKDDLGHASWDDYLENGPIAALRVAREITKVKQVNALGFCVGGTILTSALAVLKARGENPVASLTLLTTLLDFSDTGEIGLFIDEKGVAAREGTIGKGGLLPARDLANTFSFLRANDLVWNYVTGNYLKGQKPQAFDLLYWNSDSTNLPGPFACWYMRNMYLENNLRVPGKLDMCGTRVDLGQLDMPVYLLATREDHIVPWHSAYQSTRLLGGKARFVLGASGHIAGVINPVSKNKRSYWVNEDVKNDAEGWLTVAEERKGSWWADWADWLKPLSGEQRAPRKPGNAKYKPIEPAPGRYVKERAV
ncbi:MAG: class I poly(R)-hydroxyalkanoic acid synthase [Betaproteobacteria bacterium HGW-Betaproteobacteria-6]|nr:MAG: class I poly(R)-hydroxyalkanoic acid synthase [Betaproteobacteria bacterium HGW-Betaproteobacteria-6]